MSAATAPLDAAKANKVPPKLTSLQLYSCFALADITAAYSLILPSSPRLTAHIHPGESSLLPPLRLFSRPVLVAHYIHHVTRATHIPARTAAYAYTPAESRTRPTCAARDREYSAHHLQCMSPTRARVQGARLRALGLECEARAVYRGSWKTPGLARGTATSAALARGALFASSRARAVRRTSRWDRRARRPRTWDPWRAGCKSRAERNSASRRACAFGTGGERVWCVEAPARLELARGAQFRLRSVQDVALGLETRRRRRGSVTDVTVTLFS
ncbi:hypothetical protein C8J57DRAFT_1531991 [Mycena rebaudengoi]|nr:hypothetical protein C8J57DRAFT_1531991 [Mycena rebaudengoi]